MSLGPRSVDINPFAIAIARFRLIVAALRACGIKRINKASAWNIHLATEDSLLFGSRWDQHGKKRAEEQFLDESWAPEIYACEDKDAISEALGQQYHAVVGNPPFITPKDSASRKEYRKRYKTAYDKYHLSTPFTERFFELAGVRNGSSAAGYVGLIKDNAFMKRDFGKKLIEDFFPRVDLTHVIDTSGAYIPGHGTPTVILFGRNQRPIQDTVRAVLGIRGEPQRPEPPVNGKVWQSIVLHIDHAESEDDYTSVSQRCFLTLLAFVLPQKMRWPRCFATCGLTRLIYPIAKCLAARPKCKQASSGLSMAVVGDSRSSWFLFPTITVIPFPGDKRPVPP